MFGFSQILCIKNSKVLLFLISALAMTKTPTMAVLRFFMMTEPTLHASFLIALLTLNILTYFTRGISSIPIFFSRTFQTPSKKLIRKLKIFRKGRYQNFCDKISSKFFRTVIWKDFLDTSHIGNPILFKRKIPKVFGNTPYVCFIEKIFQKTESFQTSKDSLL